MAELSANDRNNEVVDYICGFQILDNKKRIYILESQIKFKLFDQIIKLIPHNSLNNNYKYLRNSDIKYNCRIYE